MGKHGHCPICGKYKYLNGRICKTCTYGSGTCLRCERMAKIYVDGLCYLCYQDRQVLSKIEGLEKKFTPLNEYNKQLFQLYLSYIKRYRLFYAHIRITRQLINLLQKYPIATIKRWFDLYELSDRYLIFQKPKQLQGCVFIKIGYMLSELGIIPPREDELDGQIKSLLDHFSTNDVYEFSNSLLRINSAKQSVLNHLRSLRKLESFSIQEFGIYSLLLLDRFHLLQFFDMITEIKSSLQNKRKIYFEVRRFYEWAILGKLILTNPCPKIDLGRPPGKLTICSENQFLDLKSYIKNPDTDPEKAFLLSLVLFFGLSTIHLAQAQVINQNNRLCIKLRRKELTKGKRYYCRKELLQLPQTPKWFFELQKRFFKKWSEHYQQVKKTYPNTPLVLPYSNIANRYLNTDTVRQRVANATQEATGEVIPVRILKQTCGHLYASKADASILTTMGWSDQFAFHYTWLPRTYYKSTK